MRLPGIRTLALLLGLVRAASADPVEPRLIPVGAEWRLSPAPAGAPADTDWTGLEFNDSAWPRRPSGFGDTSHGEQTRWSTVPGITPTVRFRHVFQVTTPGDIRALTLRVDHSGGWVAYLNGTEVGRRGLAGLPGEPVPPAVAGAFRSPGAAAEVPIPLPDGLLLPGPNVLAIQAHSDGVSALYPVLVPELLAHVVRGPYLQRAAPGRVVVRWTAAAAGPAELEWRPVGGAAQAVPSPDPGPAHRIALDALPPGVPCEYRVRVRLADAWTETPWYPFRPLPGSGPITVWALGDSGSGSAGQFAVARVLRNTPADLVVHLGDIVYPMFTFGLTDTRLLSVYGDLMRSTPFAFTWGNHDLYAGTDALVAALESSGNDVPAARHAAERSHAQAFHSFDAGDVHFVVAYQPVASQYLLSPSTAQYGWIERDLAATDRPWKVLLTHHPWTTSGHHRVTDFNLNGIADRFEIGPALMSLASRHGVQLLLHGHEHGYERLRTTNGATTVITGGGGVALYGFRELDPQSAQYHLRHHATRLRFDADEARVEAVGTDGRVFDAFTLRRTPSPAGPHAMPWRTPAAAEGGLPDGDGNLTGERHVLDGPGGVTGRTGRMASAGTLHTALDATALRIGLSGCMIPPDADLLLFAEVPGMDGVPALAGLGNGAVDPDGEGADAIDLLENLAFEGFRPGIAAVLGDEHADGTLRAFRRPGAATGLGQGVFRLAAGLPELPGARVRQFNRSPQSGPMPGEQNADFIEVTLPRSALGALPAGGTVRIAVVVATGSPDPTTGRRALDPGFIGTSLELEDGGGARVAPVTWILPGEPDPDGDGLDAEAEALAGTDPLRADTDGDGLPDGWEVRHSLDPLSGDGLMGAGGDPDGDGILNSEELASGLNPVRSDAPALRLAARRGAGGVLELAWPAVVGRRYQVETADDLTGPYSPAPGFPRTATLAEETLEVPDAGGPRFYRLRPAP